MRTYTHGVTGYLLYAKRPRHKQRLAIMGSILPDVFLALGFVAHYGAIVTQSPDLMHPRERQRRAILGVVDGSKPSGVEDQAGITWRKQLLRQIGYKLA